MKFAARIACLVAFFLLVQFVGKAFADAPQMDVSADAVIEVGAAGTVKLQASGADAQDPQLTGASNAVVVSGASIFNIAIQGKQITIANWTVRGKSVGAVTLTPSVASGGKRWSGKPVTIKIVAAGSGPKSSGSGSSPFRFGFAFPGLVDNDDPPPPLHPTTDPSLALEQAPAPTAFIRATIDKKNAVVGEQVILEVDLYTGTGTVEPDFNDPHEASTPKFQRHSMMKDDMKAERVGQGSVGGHVWDVKRIRRAVLFPLEAGELQIGAMQMTMMTMRGRAVRLSDPLTVHVVEPPTQGRPPGYSLGDVGSYTLAVEVSPREVKRGDVVSVRAEISGNGNIPSAIPLPARAGIEWMDSEVHEKIGRIDVDHWGGTKTLTYVVRMVKEGDVELGDIALPVWNAEKNAYDDLRAPLGRVHVLAGTGQANALAAELPELPPARTSLAGIAPRKHLDDSPLFWIGLLAPAAIFASAAGARSAVRRAKQTLVARATSPERELARRIRGAEETCKKSDAYAADAAIVRALEQATVVRRSINVRGLTNDEAARALESAGTGSETAREVTAILRECEEARFSPDDEGMKTVQKRWERAQKAMAAL